MELLKSDWNYSDLIEQRVEIGCNNPTENKVLAGEREHFNTDGIASLPLPTEEYGISLAPNGS